MVVLKEMESGIASSFEIMKLDFQSIIFCLPHHITQLFSFGDGEFSGSIFLNIPLVLYQDKRMCLEAVNKTKEGPQITVRDCDPASVLQKFEFERG